MIVAMQETATEDQIQVVVEHLIEMGFSVHRTTGERQTILAAVGSRTDFDTRNLEVLSGVMEVHRISAPYKLAGRSFRPQGTVIDLAFYQGGADALRLGEEFHHNGLNIRCAQINRVPRGLDGLWTRRRLAHETIGLLQSHGKIIREHMITHVVPFADGPQFLADLVTNRPDFLQIIFAVNE